jgi:hypothetical protein
LYLLRDRAREEPCATHSGCELVGVAMHSDDFSGSRRRRVLHEARKVGVV